ncbi:MAG: hypothetical protein ABII00_10245 [Elusimicrobiota bacterium]
MKRSHQVLVGTAAVVVLAASARWAYVTYRIVRPSFALQMVETSTFRAWYPAHWEKFDTRDPAIGDDWVLFSNHGPYDRDQPHWDVYRCGMSLTDETASENGTKSLDDLMKEIREGAVTPAPIRTWNLRNGVSAKTWTQYHAFIDGAVHDRWIVFKGPNGHVYFATFRVPEDLRTRWRYEYLFRNILASMEFKPAD